MSPYCWRYNYCVNERGRNSLIPSNKYKIKKIDMFNLYLSVDQEKKEQQALDAIHDEAGLNTDIYSTGYFEGYIGMEPRHPEDHIYWSGYEVGSREHWAKKLGVEIPTEF